MSILTVEQEKKIIDNFNSKFPGNYKYGANYTRVNTDHVKSFLLSTIEACLKERDREILKAIDEVEAHEPGRVVFAKSDWKVIKTMFTEKE